MQRNRGMTLAEVIVFVTVSLALAAFFMFWLRPAWESSRRTSCMSSHRQIGLAMFQYAGDHNDSFMPLVDARGNEVPAVDNEGRVSDLPAHSGFVILLHDGYLTSPKVFVCRSSSDRVSRDMPTDYRKASLAELVAGFHAGNCSYGWDPTKRHDVDATCAIIADNPPASVSTAANGTAANNSPNHAGRGQNVFYNDGHVKWGNTPQPDAGSDPDFYTGALGYEHSNTDAKIVR